jgi:hypothetical protein
LTRRKTLVFGLVSLAVMATLTLAGAELLARLTGIHPWTKADLQSHVTPGGRLLPLIQRAAMPSSLARS